MPVTIPNSFVGQATLSAAQLDANFDAVESYSSQIPGSDISSGTIPNSALVASNFDVCVNLHVPKAQLLVSAGSTIPTCVAGLPSNEAGAAYTVKYISYFVSDPGTASATLMDIKWGYANGLTWTNVTTIISGISVAGGGATTLTSGGATPTGTAITTDNTNIRMFGLFITQGATALLNTATSFLSVTLRLTRALEV